MNSYAVTIQTSDRSPDTLATVIVHHAANADVAEAWATKKFVDDYNEEMADNDAGAPITTEDLLVTAHWITATVDLRAERPDNK